MDTKLKFEFKKTYGRMLAYPLNDQAVKILKLVNRKDMKALNMDQIRALEDMGFEIIQATESKPWQDTDKG
jgi:hypothetical protein